MVQYARTHQGVKVKEEFETMQSDDQKELFTFFFLQIMKAEHGKCLGKNN